MRLCDPSTLPQDDKQANKRNGQQTTDNRQRTTDNGQQTTDNRLTMPESEINIEELKKMLKRVVWDYNIPEDELIEIFLHDKKGHSISGDQLKARLLNTYNWYYLLNFFGENFAKNFLKDKITRNLFPKSLRDKYVRAGHILST